MNYQLFEAINNLAGHSNLLDIFMIDLSKYAPLLFALALGLYFIKAFKTHDKILLKQSTAAGVLLTLNLALSKLLGHFFFETRPFVDHTVNVLYYHIADASFPSDHAIGAMSIALGIYAINKNYGQYNQLT